MSAKILCGAEHPLGINSYLARLNEDTGSVELWDQGIDEAFRYCFVPVRSPSIRDALELLSRFPQLKLNQAQLLVGWRFFESGPLHVRSKFLRSSLKRAGWTVGVVDDIALGRRDIGAANNDFNLPNGCEKSLQGFFLLFGDSVPLAKLCALPYKPSVRHFSITQRFQPSAEFVRSICAEGITVAYVSTDSDVRSGVVLVGPNTNVPDVSEMQRDGLLAQTLRNHHASLVWAS